MSLRAVITATVLAIAPCAAAQVTTSETPAGPAKPAQKPKVEKAVPPKGAGVSPKTPPQDPGAVFAGLIGSCWQAPLGQGNGDQGNTDTHCFTVSFNGKLVMDVHKVRNASQVVVYEGVTVYRPDAKSRSLSYDYANSFGNVIKGQAWRTGAELSFSSQTGVLAKAETTWRIVGDGYRVAPADPKAAKLQFKRLGPAGQGF